MSYTLCEICHEIKPTEEVSGFSTLDRVCWECQSNPLALAVKRAQELKTELTEMWMIKERRRARGQPNA